MSAKQQLAKESFGKGKKDPITVDVKKEIIAKHERGVRVADLAREYGRSSSTISTILKRKEQFKTFDVAKGVTNVTKKRPKLLDDVERLLLVWMNERQLHSDSVSEAIVCAKARVLFMDLVRKIPDASSEDEQLFKASRGWFENFRKRSGIHNVVPHGKAASSDKAVAETFVPQFQEFVDREQFLPQQVFNCDETGLFWKKLPKRTYITQEEQSLPGHKPMKDRLTLVLCANASGDCKVKPLLVYHSENPRVFKALRNYLVEKQLPLRALLVLDNAPAHPPEMQDDLFPENQFITIKFLPPNTTPLLQSMDKQVIANFKKLYMKALLERCVHVIDTTGLTLKQFWKDHFNIMGALRLIDKAWEGVSRRTLHSAWRNLWPEGVPMQDFESFGPAPEDDPDALLGDDIVALGQTLGLEVDAADVQELVEEHSDDLTTEELLELQKELVQQEVKELSSGEEEVWEDAVPSSEIRDVLVMFEKVTAFVEKHHPDKAVTTRCVNMFNDNVLSRFRDILKRRQFQVALDTRCQGISGFIQEVPAYIRLYPRDSSVYPALSKRFQRISGFIQEIPAYIRLYPRDSSVYPALSKRFQRISGFIQEIPAYIRLYPRDSSVYPALSKRFQRISGFIQEIPAYIRLYIEDSSVYPALSKRCHCISGRI
ncbi:tigger transposable element-derived protein 1-like [Procambarus clarkii]|uniref:tigger transposable element-derived protein 1-like n=1 Tax=Procambarus clarkii TaxID=6728 RepID=UPI0037420E44